MTADVMGEQVRAGVRAEIVTVVWMVLEAAIGIGAGIAAGSALLTAFGIDSVIELISGSILLWRLSIQARGGDLQRVERAERRSALIVAAALGLLCLYVLGSALHGLISHAHPERSPVGIGLAAAALIVMPWLAAAKRRNASQINSGALRGDAASSSTCAYMAGTVLAGLALNAALGWWWAEDVTALAFLVWLAGETREALEEAREG
jgi:divalent metal cation (Fe/Co/Zn/Cd) transporter